MIAIAGRPNVGKSTFLNHVVGTKVAIVTPKPQTTRDRILGILTRGTSQFLFYDAPGIHEPRKALNKRMVREAVSALADCDACLLMSDALDPHTCLKADRLVLERVKSSGKPTVLALNKIDLANKNVLLPVMDAYARFMDFRAIVPICALTGDGVDRLLKEVEILLPVGPFLYPEDQVTDRHMRAMTAEIIREKVIMETRAELPYSTAVVVDEFKVPEYPAPVVIFATVLVERESQKPIVIGKKAQRLKRIGVLAREELEFLLRRKVYLSLHVKVDPNWPRTEAGLKRAGYG